MSSIQAVFIAWLEPITRPITTMIEVIQAIVHHASRRARREVGLDLAGDGLAHAWPAIARASRSSSMIQAFSPLRAAAVISSSDFAVGGVGPAAAAGATRRYQGLDRSNSPTTRSSSPSSSWISSGSDAPSICRPRRRSPRRRARASGGAGDRHNGAALRSRPRRRGDAFAANAIECPVLIARAGRRRRQVPESRSEKREPVHYGGVTPPAPAPFRRVRRGRAPGRRRTGWSARSRPKVDIGPWPGTKTVSSPSGHSRPVIASIRSW